MDGVEARHMGMRCHLNRTKEGKLQSEHPLDPYFRELVRRRRMELLR